MAPRKPKTQPTGIIDVVKDIVSPWLGAPAGQNRSVTQAQGLARSAAETLDQTFAGGMIKAGVQGNKALAKQAAINAGALATGYVAGKTIQTAAGAVVKSGVPAQILNKVTGKTVIMHGTNVKGLQAAGKQLMPNVPPARLDVGKVLFGVKASPMYDKETLANIVHRYALERSSQNQIGSKPLKNFLADRFEGAAYVAKVPTKSIVNDGITFVRSSAPGKIVSEIPISATGSQPTADFIDRLAKAYTRAGGTYPKMPKEPKFKVPKKSGPVRS